MGVLLTSDGMPMNARIEILQGPDTNKQVIELYSENGLDRPFFCTFATPWSGNVIRILNTGPMEYPLTAERQGDCRLSSCLLTSGARSSKQDDSLVFYATR